MRISDWSSDVCSSDLAQRNEFEFEGRRFYAIAGSAYLVAPSTWSHEATSILDDLDVLHRNDPRDHTDSDLYSSHDMAPAVLFTKEVYGKDHLVRGSVKRPTPEYLAKTPMSPKGSEETTSKL